MVKKKKNLQFLSPKAAFYFASFFQLSISCARNTCLLKLRDLRTTAIYNYSTKGNKPQFLRSPLLLSFWPSGSYNAAQSDFTQVKYSSS